MLGKSALPDSWKIAKVALLFKKGNVVGFKVFAAMIHQRLINSSVDDDVWHSQYGFRPRKSSSDALLVIRRIVDAACDAKNEKLMMVFLDWAKAFDRIKTDIMCRALTRFGLPLKMVNMIRGIYDGRQFFIAAHTGNSSIHEQAAGIAQGCPLSPFLFILVQSVMFHDIYKSVHLYEEPAFLVTKDLLYADDTALLSGSQGNFYKYCWTQSLLKVPNTV